MQLTSVHQTLPLPSWVHRGPYGPGSLDLVRIMWLIQAMKCELKSRPSLLGDEEASSVPSLLSLPLPILAQELKDSKMAEKHDGKSLDRWGTTWGQLRTQSKLWCEWEMNSILSNSWDSRLFVTRVTTLSSTYIIYVIGSWLRTSGIHFSSKFTKNILSDSDIWKFTLLYFDS